MYLNALSTIPVKNVGTLAILGKVFKKFTFKPSSPSKRLIWGQ